MNLLVPWCVCNCAYPVFAGEEINLWPVLEHPVHVPTMTVNGTIEPYFGGDLTQPYPGGWWTSGPCSDPATAGTGGVGLDSGVVVQYQTYKGLSRQNDGCHF